LNVSRSFSAKRRQCKKDKQLHQPQGGREAYRDLFKKDRKAYEEKWGDIGIFVKYGGLSDEKFYEKAKDFLLLTNTSKSEFFTLDEYSVKVKDFQTDKSGQQVWLYTADAERQHSYVAASA
jgi:molecular chaperone HtpG